MLTKFENKVEEINGAMSAMGNKIIDANKVILAGLESGNYSNYEKAKLSLDAIHNDASEIDNQVVTALAIFSPEAGDLKNMISYLKVTNEYVRAASNTKSFLKNFPSKNDGDIKLDSIMSNIILLQKATINALTFAVAIIDKNDKSDIKDLCVKANIEETKTDDIYSMVEKNLFVEMLNVQELSKEYFDALSLIRKIEKIGDRAANIANTLYDGRVN